MCFINLVLNRGDLKNLYRPNKFFYRVIELKNNQKKFYIKLKTTLKHKK